MSEPRAIGRREYEAIQKAMEPHPMPSFVGTAPEDCFALAAEYQGKLQVVCEQHGCTLEDFEDFTESLEAHCY